MSSNTNDLKLPAAIKAASGTRDTRCNAAWFIEEVYKLNPAHNVLEKKALVLAEWEGFVKANFPQLMEEMKEETRTPRVQRLWADLQINYALYKNLDSIRRLPLSRIVGWPLGERKKVAVLYGLPGTVVFLQFYGDLPLNRLHYSFMADDIQHMNPTLSITTEMIDVIFSHILQNEYREEPEEVIRSRVEHQLLYAAEIYWKCRKISSSAHNQSSIQNVMIVPSKRASYADHSTACHSIHPHTPISREQVYESFQWLVKQSANLTGAKIKGVLEAAIPFNMELYHSAVEILRRAIDDKSTMRSTATATISRNSISSQPPLNAHRLLTVGPSNRILPLTLSSIPTPPQPCVSENPLHASFSYQYYLLNPSVLKTSAETTTAWQAMLAASYNNTATSRPPNSTSTRTEHVGSETITEKSAVLDDGPDEDKKAKQVPGRSQALKRACEDGEEPAVLFDPETYRKMRRLH